MVLCTVYVHNVYIARYLCSNRCIVVWSKYVFVDLMVAVTVTFCIIIPIVQCNEDH